MNAIIGSAVALALLVPVPAAGEDMLILHEPSSGATLTLPADWSFAKSEGALMAVSGDKRGFVLVAAVEEDFEQVRDDVRALIVTRLDDVEIAGVSVEGVDARGSLEELVAAEGRGTSRMDGEKVDFSGLLVRSGERGALVLGAWKDARHADRVAGILAGLEVRQSAGSGGLEVTNARTGATITLPEGWDVARSRKGLVARAPDGGAMALLMPWQDDFEQALARARVALVTKVLEDVSIGQFVLVEGGFHESLGRALIAKGEAKDRADGRPVQFKVLRLHAADRDEGAALFGAWKDEEHAAQIERLLASVRIDETRRMPRG